MPKFNTENFYDKIAHLKEVGFVNIDFNGFYIGQK